MEDSEPTKRQFFSDHDWGLLLIQNINCFKKGLVIPIIHYDSEPVQLFKKFFIRLGRLFDVDLYLIS